MRGSVLFLGFSTLSEWPILPYSDIHHNPLCIFVDGETHSLAPEVEFAQDIAYVDTRSNASYFGIGSDLDTVEASYSDHFYT